MRPKKTAFLQQGVAEKQIAVNNLLSGTSNATA